MLQTFPEHALVAAENRFAQSLLQFVQEFDGPYSRTGDKEGIGIIATHLRCCGQDRCRTEPGKLGTLPKQETCAIQNGEAVLDDEIRH